MMCTQMYRCAYDVIMPMTSLTDTIVSNIMYNIRSSFLYIVILSTLKLSCLHDKKKD